MYSINNKKIKGKTNIKELEGFNMGSSNKSYSINGVEVKKIAIQDTDLANPIVTEVVLKKYKKLIEYVTNLLIEEDDDTGDSIREALNQIEKFRQEIKNKYRDYLKRKELEMMSKQLMLLKKEAENRLIQIRENLINIKEGKRSK